MIPLPARRRTTPAVPACLVAMLSLAFSPSFAADVQQLLGGVDAAAAVPAEPAVPRRIVLVAADVVGDPADTPPSAARLPDPLRGSERIDPAVTGPDAAGVLSKLLPPRTDTAADWYAPVEPLHDCGEPRLLPPCVPPPPCHPSLPPHPYDLVGVAGVPTCGPIYRGPCAPRSATKHTGALKHVRTAHDRLFDWFYRPK
jgi:hypothetical protein